MIHYENYSLLMLWMDAHFTRERKPMNAFVDTGASFQTAVNKTHKARNSLYSNASNSSAPLPYFQTFLPMGKSDVLGMVTLESLEDAQWLMASVDRTIEEATQAFCIRPDSWSASKELGQHLCSVGELLSTDNTQKHPLLVLTRLKLEGLLLMLDPVLAQTSAVDMCLTHILEAWKIMMQSRSKLLEGVSDGSWRLALLDLQEEEEIGLLFTCTNLSVPAGLVAAVRGLVINDLVQHCPKFQKLLSMPFADDLIHSCKKASSKTRTKAASADVNYGHVFRWTRSSVALNLAVFHSADFAGVHGFAASLVEVNHPPGHHAEGNQIVLDLKIPRTEMPEEEFYIPYYFGSVDMLSGSVLHDSSKEATWLGRSAFVKTRDVFGHLHQLCSKLAEGTPIWPSRHIIGWVTTLVAPVPVLKTGELNLNTDHRIVSEKHFPFLQSALTNCLDKLLPIPRQTPDGDGTKQSQEGDDLAPYVRCLREAFGFIGLPAGLRRAFMVLFQKYRTLASHPMRYDAVLDLYDVMGTLWNIFVHLLPQAIWPELENRDFGTAPEDLLNAYRRLDARQIDFLGELADAIESSIDLRLRRTFPNTPEHEWDLDFRGSMNQAVIAGETVLRIALGLVRRHALHPSKNDRLGMANRMTITASISTVFGDLGVENQARVAYADTDVSHLTNLVHLADYFHEAFHVIHMEMCSNETGDGNEKVVQIKGCLYQLFNSGFNEEENAADRWIEETGEVFVAMMMYLLIADGDIDLLWHNQAHTFGTQPLSALSPHASFRLASQASKRELHGRFGKVFVPIGILSCWLLSKGILQKVRRGSAFMDVAFDTQATRPEPLPPDEAVNVYEKYCKQILQILPEAYPVQVAESSDGLFDFWREMVTLPFETSWSHLLSSRALDIMWDVALVMTSRIISEAAPEKVKAALDKDSTGVQNHRAAAPATIWKSLCSKADGMLENWSEGVDMAPISLTQMFEGFDAKQEWEDRHSLPTIFLMRALRQAWSLYLPDPRQPGKEWRLPRKLRKIDQEERTNKSDAFSKPLVDLAGYEAVPDWKSGPKNFAHFLVDPYRPENFCTKPEAAARLLKHQAVFIKTLWGISSIIRRRRLKLILQDDECADAAGSGHTAARP